MSLNMETLGVRPEVEEPKGHLSGYSGHIPGMKDFGEGVSYQKYTAAYMAARSGEGEQGTDQLSQTVQGAVSDLTAPSSTLKTLGPGRNSLPSSTTNHTTSGVDLGDHTALTLKNGHSNVFTASDDSEMYVRTMANLEKTRKLRNSMPMAGYTGCLP